MRNTGDGIEGKEPVMIVNLSDLRVLAVNWGLGLYYPVDLS
jgi:hypothetical protein